MKTDKKKRKDKKREGIKACGDFNILYGEIEDKERNNLRHIMYVKVR